ncbi:MULTISPECIES: hypothetical protein [Roseomonadaceae]|uniref:Uncharacterized protein n=1 Tax=Falsiroseomonas oleicola TaxID=2801474 RepID=A0ABS6H5Q6_9PROT|nr:hypothetical protein [Roseomonas oleicola]MBU8544012.1 hypothetical protein [Roseomonas oleicola]
MTEQNPTAVVPFQARVAVAVAACLGDSSAADLNERRLRFLEEALEVFQAPGPDGSPGLTEGAAIQVVRYVFAKPPDPIALEVGHAVLALAALASAAGVDMAAAGEADLLHIQTNAASIARRHAAKPRIAQ